jgi:large subunit ribosomal protein L13
VTALLFASAHASRYSSPSRAQPGALVSIDLSERMKTYVAKPSTIEKKWYVVDAKGQTLGRLATVVADTLRGKRKPIYTPNIDTGDFVVIVNAEQIVVTGKKPEQKMYYHHSGYPGGIKSESYASSSPPPRRSSATVRGMLRTTSRRAQLRKLRSTRPEHPHEAQNPEVLEIKE